MRGSDLGSAVDGSREGKRIGDPCQRGREQPPQGTRPVCGTWDSGVRPRHAAPRSADGRRGKAGRQRPSPIRYFAAGAALGGGDEMGPNVLGDTRVSDWLLRLKQGWSSSVAGGCRTSRCDKHMVPGAGPLFNEPGTLEAAARVWKKLGERREKIARKTSSLGAARDPD